MKKILSLILCVILLTGVTVGIGITALADDGAPVFSVFGYGDTTVTTEEAGQKATLWIFPEESGRYCIYSHDNDGKPVVCNALAEVLDDGNYIEVAQDTCNVYNGDNFAVFATLQAGRRYQLECFFDRHGDAGSFTVSVAENPYQRIQYMPKSPKLFTEFTHGGYVDGVYYYFETGNKWKDLFETGDRFSIYYTDGSHKYWEISAFDASGAPVLTDTDNAAAVLPLSLYMETDQHETPWEVGWHHVIVRMAQCSDRIPTRIDPVGWYKSDGKWYYSKNGVNLKGWLKDGVKWYLLRYSDGSMIKGWAKTGGKWYYLNSGGAMVTGWFRIGGKWYYFNSDGAMVTGWFRDGYKWYYLNSNGDMRTGWLKSGGKWYYLDSSGAMLTSTSRKIGKKTYKFNASGVCTNP